MLEVKIITITGARLQSIKAAIVSRAINEHNRLGMNPHIGEKIVHTEQRYHEDKTCIFFRLAHIQEPAANLHLHGESGKKGEMTRRND